MTSGSNFLIGPIGFGISNDQKPWSNPADSWEDLTNAYQFRGRLVRRKGYKTLGRLTNGTPVMGLRTRESIDIDAESLIAFDTTNDYLWNGSAFVPLPSVMPVTWSGTNYQFFYSINYANAFWATNSKPGLHGKAISGITNAVDPTAQVTTTTPHGFTTGQTVVFINVAGMVEINGLSDTITVTGANTFTLDTIDTSGFGVYTGGGFALNSSVSITGQDGIRYYGILSNGTGWANYNPPIDPNNALAGCLLMFAYRGYLVFLNTTEGNENGLFNFGNRARWTQIGTPYYSAPQPVDPAPQGIDVKTARDDLFGRGGANDAPTNEVIVGAAFIKDILIVYFENSTWRLRFVNNAQNPFVWERVNVELGSKSTFSTIPFDKGLMAVGTRGIVISDGNDTVRFDDKIPDEIFNIRQTNQGLQRVCGIRTFRSKLNYWTFPDSQNQSGTFPDRVLVYNYDSKQWSFFDDSYTCFGYYYESSPGLTWNDLPDDWASYTNVTWNSGISQQGYENIVAGNQQGYVLILETNGGQNDVSLSISAIAGGLFTSNNNNLPDGSWIKLVGITGTTSDDGVSLNGRNFKVSNPTLDPNSFTLSEFKPILAPNAVGSTYSYDIEYASIVPGSVQITVGALTFTDPDLNGSLTVIGDTSTGTIDYETGIFTLNFSAPIGSTAVVINLVTLDPQQGLAIVNTTGAYTGGGEIIRISNYDILSKFFNFFPQDQRSRLSKIDFYVNATSNGEFTCNVFGDSSNEILNTPFEDNPFSNIVETSTNPNQIGQGSQTIFRLYCDAIAQTIQLQFTMSDYQQAVDVINSADMEILALMVTAKPGSRLP
jgi:hypothetical protein